MVPKLSCFGSGSFSEMVNSFGLPDCGQMSYEKAIQTSSHYQKDCQNPEEKGSPNQKSKRKASDSDSPYNSNKNGAEQQYPDPSAISLGDDEKKQKIEQNITSTLLSKQTGKQVKENSDSGDAAKDNYIHVRAKRGEATNSHSLGERVRREKISERMRLLQELVPGCNKITGKALMLDEIINYVQSLQQQVEVVDGKLSQTYYLMALDSCYSRYCAKYEKWEGKAFLVSKADYFVFHSPYNKAGKRVIMFSYGSGLTATMFSFQLREEGMYYVVS